ncbi:MAG: hypothetical protein RLZZ337_570 [Bacteroidota bacterium]|jgi:hypothetical protein
MVSVLELCKLAKRFNFDLVQRNSKIIARLTALWALSEAGLGGILHALQSPFTGLFVGGFAIILISLIAYFADDKWETIFRSLLVVLIIKVAVSPHSPPTSYLAVSFQAFVGALIYSKLRVNMWSAVMLGVITLIESAVQKLLVVWLIFGQSIWNAIDEFHIYVENKFWFLGELLSVQVLISTYLWVYAIIGAILGYIIYDVIQYLDYNQGNVKYQIQAIEFDNEIKVNPKMKGRWRQWVIFGGFLALTLAYYFFVKDGDAVWKNWLYITLRTAGILLLWYYVIAPLVKKWLSNFLEGKKHRVQQEVDETLTLLPYLTKVIKLAWKENKDEKGFRVRMRGFIGDSILYSIHLQLEEE